MNIKHLNRFLLIITMINLGTISMANAKSAYDFNFESIEGGIIQLNKLN